MTDIEIVDFIVTHFEGGFVDDPDDRGGATHFGVTQAALGRARDLGRPATVDEVRALTRDAAVGILWSDYVHTPKFSGILNWRLKFAVVDYGINSGVVHAARVLQRVLGVRPDGKMGPLTLAAANALNPDRVRAISAGVLADRIRLVGRLVTRKPELRQHRFGEGWCNRIATVLETIAA